MTRASLDDDNGELWLLGRGFDDGASAPCTAAIYAVRMQPLATLACDLRLDDGAVREELQVSCNVEGATIAIDGETVGSFPLPEPVKVASGRIILQATKKGYQAGYQAVSASGGQVLPVTIELVEASKPPAQLKIRSNLPGAEVWIDGYLVATTPLKSTLPVTPDKQHRIEVRREGYVTASETLTLGQGAMSELVLEPQEDPQAIQQSGGTLDLELGAVPFRHRVFGHLTTRSRGFGMGFGGLSWA